MRIFVLALLVSIVSSATAQTAPFNNTFPLRDGIYVTYKELLNNAPSFPNCILLVNANKSDINITDLRYCYKGMEDDQMPYTSQLFAIVENGKFFVYYEKKLIPVFSKGTLCRFMYTRLVSTGSTSNNTQSSKFKSDICILDIQTGQTYMLKKENLARSIKRDASLYATYSKTKPGKRNKNLFKYISDFNTNNPTHIPVKEQPPIIEE